MSLQWIFAAAVAAATSYIVNDSAQTQNTIYRCKFTVSLCEPRPRLQLQTKNYLHFLLPPWLARNGLGVEMQDPADAEKIWDL